MRLQVGQRNDDMSLVVTQKHGLVGSKLHIGKIVKKVLEESGMSVTEFARRMNCTRPNVYDIFDRSDIGVEQLIEISKVLNHNFFDDIQDSLCLDSRLQVQKLDIHIDIENLAPDRVLQVNELLGKLCEFAS